MRILVLSNLYPPAAVGGYEVRCAHTVEWLAREHDVLVLTSRRGRGRSPEPQVLRKLPFLPEAARGTLLAPLAALYATRLLLRVVCRYEPDLVFVWNASHVPRAAIRALGLRGDVPLAFSVADPWIGRFAQGDQFLRYLGGETRGVHRIWSLLVGLVNRLPSLRIELRTPMAAALVWNSEALRSMTRLPSFVMPTLERVIHPASNCEELFANVERRPAPTPTIAYVGRIEPEKAPDVAVRALALLRDRHGIDARLLVMGGGERTEVHELEALVRELGLRDAVQLRGRRPAEEVAAALAQSHAIVVPSRWQEPFGLVCLEAALARVPIVASLSGGMPEMLEDGEEALFFAIDDVQACADALARTLEDREGAERRARRARRRAEDYSLARYRAAYAEFVEGARAAARDVVASRAVR